MFIFFTGTERKMKRFKHTLLSLRKGTVSREETEKKREGEGAEQKREKEGTSNACQFKWIL